MRSPRVTPSAPHNPPPGTVVRKWHRLACSASGTSRRFPPKSVAGGAAYLKQRLTDGPVLSQEASVSAVSRPDPNISHSTGTAAAPPALIFAPTLRCSTGMSTKLHERTATSCSTTT